MNNGFEFINRLTVPIRDLPTLLETVAASLSIFYKLILHYTPRHNGRVGIATERIRNAFTDFQLQLEAYSYLSN